MQEQTAALESDERYTPEPVLNVVRQHAPIALDPCTTADNITNAHLYYTPKEDGLKQSWSLGKVGSLVFVNPPYSRGSLAAWADKARGEHLSDPDIEIIMLTPCDLGTRWASNLFAECSGIAFWKGRIAFTRPDGAYDAGAKQPSCFWYLGDRPTRFHRVFSGHANVITKGR